MHDVTIIDRQPNVAIDQAVLFSMRNLPLLEQGTTYDPLATAENLWVNIKVYASGGENALHAHGGEDHAFIVLQGKATFTFGDGRTSVVGKYEGVMIPKNALYKFEADQSENLVLLRVGGGAQESRRSERSDAFRHAQGHSAADGIRRRFRQGRRRPPRTAKPRSSASTPRENTSRRTDRARSAISWRRTRTTFETSGDHDAGITR